MTVTVMNPTKSCERNRSSANPRPTAFVTIACVAPACAWGDLVCVITCVMGSGVEGDVEGKAGLLERAMVFDMRCCELYVAGIW